MALWYVSRACRVHREAGRAHSWVLDIREVYVVTVYFLKAEVVLSSTLHRLPLRNNSHNGSSCRPLGSLNMPLYLEDVVLRSHASPISPSIGAGVKVEDMEEKEWTTPICPVVSFAQARRKQWEKDCGAFAFTWKWKESVILTFSFQGSIFMCVYVVCMLCTHTFALGYVSVVARSWPHSFFLFNHSAPCFLETASHWT